MTERSKRANWTSRKMGSRRNCFTCTKSIIPTKGHIVACTARHPKVTFISGFTDGVRFSFGRDWSPAKFDPTIIEKCGSYEEKHAEVKEVL